MDAVYKRVARTVPSDEGVVLGGYSVRHHALALRPENDPLPLEFEQELETQDVDLKMVAVPHCQSESLTVATLREQFPDLRLVWPSSAASVARPVRAASGRHRQTPQRLCAMWTSSMLDVAVYHRAYEGVRHFRDFCQEKRRILPERDARDPLLASLELTRFNAIHMLMLVAAATLHGQVNPDTRSRIPKARKILVRALVLADPHARVDFQGSTAALVLQDLTEMETQYRAFVEQTRGKNRVPPSDEERAKFLTSILTSEQRSAFKVRMHALLRSALDKDMLAYLWRVIYDPLWRTHAGRVGGGSIMEAADADASADTARAEDEAAISVEAWWFEEEMRDDARSLLHPWDTHTHDEAALWDQVLAALLEEMCAEASYLAAVDASKASSGTALDGFVPERTVPPPVVAVGAGGGGRARAKSHRRRSLQGRRRRKTSSSAPKRRATRRRTKHAR